MGGKDKGMKEQRPNALLGRRSDAQMLESHSEQERLGDTQMLSVLNFSSMISRFVAPEVHSLKS